MRVTFRPAVEGDLPFLTVTPLPHRIRAITAVLAGEVVGIGGIGHRPDGTVVAFAEMSPEMRRYPAAVHRAGVLGMALIRRSRATAVIAEAQPGNPAAARWLIRFGFEPLGDVFVWRRRPDVERPL